MATPLDNVLNVWNKIQQNSPIYNFLLEDVQVYEASKGVVRAKLQVNERHLNSKRGLHGVFSACVVDWAGGLAIASHGFESTGVSTDIHVSYLSKASLGDWLVIESRTDKVGKTLGFTSVTISKRGEDGQLSTVAQGAHTKPCSQTAFFFASGMIAFFFDCWIHSDGGEQFSSKML
ncbi:thioesterase family protein [Talaromyces stipitatus ATCC 10500]|uniref:Thioesterase family protein n=1 Tax=Talaromyces stipitatus (strain ATCC 10500 / CBS 375.48 / QM 6759 / NRRL 1006) TaxID=441959 RepID=B8M0Y8_TALSN|nr:thioesterase family protein [Talaromyces stipitatus ATCC 10500]EED21768.1 thioesterase family protein [Talaromyces stipitatus ATCC 10500]